jgi:hypothetical protein
MPDETTASTTTAETPTTDAGAQTTGGTTGGATVGRGGKRPDELPYKEPGDVDPPEGTRDEHGTEVSRWITYLQQMLNYTYQMQVVMEDGHFGSMTANAVSHFREQTNLPAGEFVDKEFWLKLGVQDLAAEWDRQNAGRGGSGAGGQQGSGGSSGGTDFSEVDLGVSMVQANTNEACWAAALATVLNYRGESYDTDSLCEQNGQSTQEWTSLQRATAIGAQLGLNQVVCQGGTAASLAEAMSNHGPLWTPVPGNEYHVIVLAGVTANEGNPQVHVLDPTTGADSWLPMADLTAQYGISDAFRGEVLAPS